MKKLAILIVILVVVSCKSPSSEPVSIIVYPNYNFTDVAVASVVDTVGKRYVTCLFLSTTHNKSGVIINP